MIDISTEAPMSEYTREEILKLIQDNGGPRRLDLSGKDLSGIDLGRKAIAAELERAPERVPGETPVWYSEPTGGINLECANLQRANLRGANLQGALLINANLEEANLGFTNIQEAQLGGADLNKAFLMHSNLRGAGLPGVDLTEAYLADADLQTASLVRTNLQGATLVGAKLKEADLRRASLQDTAMWQADLQGANLYEADLVNTRLRRRSLGTQIKQDKERKWFEAKEVYLALKNNFAEIGRYDDAAWAYRKERRMEKRVALQEAKEAWQVCDWKRALRRYTKVGSDQLEEWVCDYGESVRRVLCSLLAVYVLFTLIYGLTWSVIRVHATPAAIIREPTRNLVDLARFSLGAMTTMGLTGLEPRNGLVELLAGLEALLGIALTGLLGFVLGNRIRRS